MKQTLSSGTVRTLEEIWNENVKTLEDLPLELADGYWLSGRDYEGGYVVDHSELEVYCEWGDSTQFNLPAPKKIEREKVWKWWYWDNTSTFPKISNDFFTEGEAKEKLGGYWDYYEKAPETEMLRPESWYKR